MQRAHVHFILLFQLLPALLYFPVYAAIQPQLEAKPFLTSTLSNNRPYVGEEVMLTYTLYFSDTAPRISNEVTPSLRGLWAKEAKPERFIKSTPATFKGMPYRSAVIKRFRLVPLQSGAITVSGYSMNCAVPAGKPVSGGGEPPDITSGITAPAVTLNTKSLPGTIPRGFSGAVGTFKLELLADKQKLRAGEPLAVTVKLSGTGSLLSLTLPVLKLPESFRSGTSELTSSLQSESAVSSGSTTSRTIVWPQSPGTFTIPALRMDVFDLQAGKFRSIESRALSVNITPPPGNALSAVKPENSSPAMERSLPDDKKPLNAPFTFFAALAILLTAGAALFLARKKRQDTTVLQPEKRPETWDSPQEVKKFIFDLLEKAGIKGPAGLTRTQLKTELRKIKELSPEQLAELTGLLDTIDRVVFTAAAGKEGELPEDTAGRVERLQNVLNRKSGSR
jgi:hypothetical protein